MLSAGSRWLPLPSGTGAPTHQQGEESIWSHLSLLWSGTTCLLSLMKIVQYLNASRTYSARAAGLCFSQPCCACPPTHLPRGTAHCFSFRALNTHCVDTTLELNQKLSLRLEMKGFRLKCVFSTIRKTLSHLVMVTEISGISQKSGTYF